MKFPLSILLTVLTIWLGLAAAKKKKEAVPLPNTDVIFVVQRGNPDNPGIYNNAKKYMREFVNTYDETIDGDDKSTVRFAVVTYDGQAVLEFNFTKGLYLNNKDALLAAIDALPLEQNSGSNLPGAAAVAGDILKEESVPSNNAFVIFLSDGTADVNLVALPDAAVVLHQNYTSVVLIKPPSAQTPGGDDVSLQLLKGDESFLIEVNSDFEVQGRKRKDIPHKGFIYIIWYTYTFMYRKVCVLSIGPCNRPCGIGYRLVSAKCTIFWKYWKKTTVISWNFYQWCCMLPCQPCQGSHCFLPYPYWPCRFLPPWTA